LKERKRGPREIGKEKERGRRNVVALCMVVIVENPGAGEVVLGAAHTTGTLHVGYCMLTSYHVY
jgi:hypothetical protein